MLRKMTLLQLRFLAISSFVFLSACTSLVVPNADQTPPESILLTAWGENGEYFRTDSGDVEWDTDMGNNFSLVATAKDSDGGLRELRIDLTADIGCTVGSTTFSTQDNILPPTVVTVSAQPGDEVEDKLLATREDVPQGIASALLQWRQVNKPSSNCDPFIFVGHVIARAENFHGGVIVSPEIEITIHTTLTEVQQLTSP